MSRFVMHKLKKSCGQTGVRSSTAFRRCSAANCSSATSLHQSALKLVATSPGRKRTRPTKKKAKAQSSTSRLLAGLKGKPAAQASSESATERCLRSVGDSLLSSPGLDPARRQRSWDIVPTPQIYPRQTSIPIETPVDYYGLSERKTLDSQQLSAKSTEEVLPSVSSDVRGELERLQ